MALGKTQTVQPTATCVHCRAPIHQNETDADADDPLVWVHTDTGYIDATIGNAGVYGHAAEPNIWYCDHCGTYFPALTDNDSCPEPGCAAIVDPAEGYARMPDGHTWQHPPDTEPGKASDECFICTHPDPVPDLIALLNETEPNKEN